MQMNEGERRFQDADQARRRDHYPGYLFGRSPAMQTTCCGSIRTLCRDASLLPPLPSGLGYADSRVSRSEFQTAKVLLKTVQTVRMVRRGRPTDEDQPPFCCSETQELRAELAELATRSFRRRENRFTAV